MTFLELRNQQATLTFNLENVDAEVRLKKMLKVEKYVSNPSRSTRRLFLFCSFK